ncbi:MAG: hypothetical protein ACTSRE_02170 [Promethearchaeota archaeon]
MSDHKFGSKSNSLNIFRKFRQGVFYEDLYTEFDISEYDLITILQSNIKGKYDYKRILKGGIAAQKQFIAHLKTRWNPLEPDKPGEDISPYLPVKKRVQDTD